MANNKPLGTRIWNKINLLLPVEIFEEMKRLKISFKELENIIYSYVEWRNDAFGINIGHDRVRLAMFDKEFAFSVSGSFTLWNSNGLTLLGTYSIDVHAPPTNDFIKWLYQIIDDYSHGVIHCSDCKKPISKGEIAGRYFAGVYCSDCWNNKWKAIEAEEDYN